MTVSMVLVATAEASFLVVWLATSGRPSTSVRDVLIGRRRLALPPRANRGSGAAAGDHGPRDRGRTAHHAALTGGYHWIAESLERNDAENVV
jgi:hypothetical protein